MFKKKKSYWVPKETVDFAWILIKLKQQAQEKCQSVKFHNQSLFETSNQWATFDSSPVVVVQLWDVRSVGEYECAGAGDCADGTGRPL